MRDAPTELLNKLRSYGQEHVLFGWATFDVQQRQNLIAQLAVVDLDLIRRLYAQRDQGSAAPAAVRIEPASMVPHHGLTDEDRRAGEEMLANGEVAVLLVAGGQGTRLGFDKPKGMFPIGPVSNKSLFQIHAEKVLATGRRYGKTPPFLIMTSSVTHDDTVAYFEEHRYFGLPSSEVYFFEQGTMPAVDLATGKLLLEKPGVLFSSPDGHGGTLAALARSGLLDDLRQRGIRSIFYLQVDNPLVNIAEPAFLGRHQAVRSEASSKAIEKAYPKEKMGVLSLIDGRCGIVEYSDMPDDLLHATDAEGRLLHRAGSPAIHIFDIDFLVRITQGEMKLPYHLAKKKVPYTDERGQMIKPEKENAIKFELFIFDALPLADRWLVQEALRQEEFSPVKNAEGVDSPATAKRDLMNLAASWLEKAGVKVARDERGNALVPVEVSAKFALDHHEMIERLTEGMVIEGPTYLE
jgi:UDP-N-acetylglucosamine/UDP-N-acetylgalactosamine diphosphorylase